MDRHAVRGAAAATRPRPFPRLPLVGLVLLGVALPAGAARAEPPITSLEDAACRAEARARVFSVPDPLNLGLREIGRQIYFGCMNRLSRSAAKGRSHRRRPRTRR